MAIYNIYIAKLIFLIIGLALPFCKEYLIQVCLLFLIRPAHIIKTNLYVLPAPLKDVKSVKIDVVPNVPG